MFGWMRVAALATTRRDSPRTAVTSTRTLLSAARGGSSRRWLESLPPTSTHLRPTAICHWYRSLTERSSSRLVRAILVPKTRSLPTTLTPKGPIGGKDTTAVGGEVADAVR